MKKICLIYCGGTIGMKRRPDGLLVPAGEAQDLLALAPGIKELAEFGYRFVADIDSTNMSPAVWEKLARTIFQEYEKYDGFVVTHGTDTMAYTASALSFTLQNLNKPVVLTGAQKSIYDLASDAPNNLINAVKVALSGIPEVVVVFGTKIVRGCRAQKKSESQLNAFWSPAVLPLGHIALEPQIDLERVWRWAGIGLKLKPDFEREVAFFQLFPGLDEKYIDAVIERGCKGIILNSYGAGNVPDGELSLLPVIKKAVGKNIPVVVATQCAQGSTRMLYETGYTAIEAGAISAFDMTSEAAATKLMWILAQTQNMEDIKKIMHTNIAGEIYMG
jgi:L-asparaginase